VAQPPLPRQARSKVLLVRVVSLNAWGGAMYDQFAAWLPTAGADVLCLQEVTRTPGVQGWTEFRDADRVLPQRADLFADAAALLPDHLGVFTASDAGPVIDRHGRRHQQQFGVAAFVTPAATVLEQAAAFVHGRYIEHEQWTVSGRPRVAHALRLTAPGLERPVTVVHLHGLRDPAGKGDTPARRDQAHQLAAFVTQVRRDGDVTVVCGDLNLLPDSDTFDVLRGIGLFDLVGTADTRTTRYRKPSRHASYLLVSHPEAVRALEVVRAPEVSDHRALTLDLA